MNAKIGLIFSRLIADPLFSSFSKEMKLRENIGTAIDVEKYNFPQLDGIHFQYYPVTQFIKEKLPLEMAGDDFVYASMNGCGLDAYEKWIQENNLNEAENHHFESGLLTLTRLAGPVAIMFAPEGDRLGVFVNVEAFDVVGLLRAGVKYLYESEGFLATIGRFE